MQPPMAPFALSIPEHRIPSLRHGEGIGAIQSAHRAHSPPPPPRIPRGPHENPAQDTSLCSAFRSLHPTPQLHPSFLAYRGWGRGRARFRRFAVITREPAPDPRARTASFAPTQPRFQHGPIDSQGRVNQIDHHLCGRVVPERHERALTRVRELASAAAGAGDRQAWTLGMPGISPGATSLASGPSGSNVSGWSRCSRR